MIPLRIFGEVGYAEYALAQGMPLKSGDKSGDEKSWKAEAEAGLEVQFC